MCVGLHVNYPLFLSEFNETLIFNKFPKSTPQQNFMKILAVGAELFQVDGRTDTTQLIVTFVNIAKAPKKSLNKVNIIIITAM